MTEKNIKKSSFDKTPAATAAQPFPAMEEEILSFWEKNNIFEKSVERDAPQGDYVFYDGPPFATGTPHYGHIVASIMKDVVPRYWTMKGYRVERKWGWDCHGLPIENIVEKELGFKSKKDIEKLGIAKFNETCRSKVLTYVDEWQKVIRRLGRWADMENAYKTMDKDYMESIWWVFKQLWDKGLVYEGYRSMHICPRCETTLSQMEVAEGYKEVKDLAVTVEFKVRSKKLEVGSDSDVYVLAWTTTPWTLPGNVALAVGKDIDYLMIEVAESKVDNIKIGERYIISKNFLQDKGLHPGGYKEGVRLEKILYLFHCTNDSDLFNSLKVYIIKKFKGKDLVGLEYEPPFDYYVKDKTLQNHANGWKVYAADFVTAEDGTGIAHEAPAFGADDWALLQKENLPFVQHVNMDGTFKDEVRDFASRSISPRAKGKADEVREIDLDIKKYLENKKLLFSYSKYPHSYPHCWRCETPLINYATSSWFVKVTAVKDKAVKFAKEINWMPGHIKDGRFGQWLEGARDWSISRQRFWASVIPIWKCTLTPNPSPTGRGESCGEIKVIGGVKELEELSGQKINDLHKHVVDKVTFPCEKCGGTMRRVPDVLDTWFDSASMPYAQEHYPFENKEKFEQNFPAEFIAEGVDQTRAWFYYLHIIAAAIKNKPAFKNVIVNGIVLAEDGKKMAKRLQNYPDPMAVMREHGADKLRYYLCSTAVVKAEDLNFSERELVDQTRFFNILLNVLTFYKMFSGDLKIENLAEKDLVNVLDKWITARLEETKKTVTQKMDKYDLHAIREIPVFINDLSTWYVRRSRERFKGDDKADKMRALQTLRRTLYHLARIMAPFLPFTAEHIYQELGADVESVHLKPWPEVREEWIDKETLANMEQVRKIVEMGLAERDKAGIKVKQPLSKLKVRSKKLESDYVELIKDEVNLKSVEFENGQQLSVELDTALTSELIQEGIKRELTRAINNLRKEAGMTIQERAIIYYQTESTDIQAVFEKFAAEIKKDTLADELRQGDGELVIINGEEVRLKVTKIA